MAELSFAIRVRQGMEAPSLAGLPSYGAERAAFARHVSYPLLAIAALALLCQGMMLKTSLTAVLGHARRRMRVLYHPG